MKILFINGSPNANGKTAALAKKLLKDQKYETLNLVDYRINTYGQRLAGDQFDEVAKKASEADVLVLGSPVYWHNMSGALRTFLDRCYSDNGPDFHGKLYFLFQGAAPEAWMLKDSEYTIRRFASLYGLEYMGMAVNSSEAEKMAKTM